MRFNSGQEFLNCANKNIALFGMSGVGKTTLSNLLSRESWFHYSVDYRIGTRYLNEEINDCFKRLAMRDPLLRQLFRQDVIYLGLNMSINNLAPLSSYVGMLGNTAQGGLDYNEFQHRQQLHRSAEIASLLDCNEFLERSHSIYGYPNFICDTGGSMIEVIDLERDDDPVTAAITQFCLPIYIEADESLLEQIILRGLAAPKPMYYNPAFLEQAIQRYLAKMQFNVIEQADPKDFAAWVLAELLHNRAPRYKRFAQQHGYTIPAKELGSLRNEKELLMRIAQAIDEQR